MVPPVGFVLITHSKPAQIIRLVSRLNRLFDYPPIVGHHDFSKCPLDASSASFTGNVSFVQPHVQTAWGEFSVVEATMQAIRKMFESPDSPDWFVLLSGADYPIKPAAQVLQDLATGSYDAHIHHELIQAGAFASKWQATCYRRYCFKSFKLPFLSRRLRPKLRKFTLRHPLLARPFLPFSKDLQCYAGGQWFCANRRSAEYILSFHDTQPALAAHYRRLKFAEESYFQTILANAPQLKLNNGTFRYVDWSASQPHPKTLTLADLPALAAAPDHFARKFDPDVDARILDELDALVI